MFRYAYVFQLITAVVVGDLVIKPENAIAIAGVETVTFTCSVNKPAKLSWKFQTATDEGEIFFDYSAMPSIHPRYKATGAYPNVNGHLEVNLVIDELDFNHAGTYTCFDAEHSSPHSARLTVVKLHPLREYASSNDSFVLGSLLEYAGNAFPRVDCFDAITNKSIDGVISNFTWTSENLTRIGKDRTIKCYVKFCFTDSDCYARIFELEILVIGLDSAEILGSPRAKTLSILSAGILAIAAVASVVLTVVFYFKSKYKPVTKNTFLEGLTMIDGK